MNEKLDQLARQLVEFRQRETLSAYVVIRMALQLGFEAGEQTGYDAGIQQAVYVALPAALPRTHIEPVGEQS